MDAARASPGAASDEPAAKRPRWLTEKRWGRLSRGQQAMLTKGLADVGDFTAAEVQEWTEAVLIAGGQEGSIADEDSDVGQVLAVLKKHKVSGAALMELTAEKLMQVNIGLGPAEVLAKCIAELKKPEPETVIRS
uniref:SAM n=1 Tax=Pfiesteria piscicida TaxID=71001 RepID=A3E3D8_PFIPI|nr:SAM-like protein [Pfiesteria piscicida]ABI14206.1 SAM [Pfiesteria piscicida]